MGKSEPSITIAFFSHAFVYESFSHHLGMSIEEQQFLVWLGKTPSQALEMFQQVYRDNTFYAHVVFEWHKRFKELWGGESWL